MKEIEIMLLWYNPDTNSYEKGGVQEFQSIRQSSKNKDRFEVLYKFWGNESKLIEKIQNSLNLAGKTPLENFEFFVFS